MQRAHPPTPVSTRFAPATLALALAVGALPAQAQLSTPGTGGPPAAGGAPSVVAPAAQPAGEPVTLWWVDYDGDGLEDLSAVTRRDTVRLLRNLGDGSFDEVTEVSGLSAVAGARFLRWGDYDADGAPDVYVGRREGGGLLFRQQAGQFLDVTLSAGIAHEAANRSAEWVDYDADGRLDLQVVTAESSRIYRGVGEGQFRAVELNLPVGGPDAGAAEAVPGGEGTDTRRVPGVRGAGGDGSGADRSRRGGGDMSGTGSGVGAAVPAGRTPVAPGSGSSDRGTDTPITAEATVIADSIVDFSGVTTDVKASTVPALGMLYPLSKFLNVNNSYGFVGVNTTAPRGGLDVALDMGGYFTVADYSATPGYPYVSTVLGGTVDGVEMRFEGGSGWVDIGKIGNGDFKIETSDVPRVTVTAGGRVGMNTTSPQANLHVVGTGGSATIPGDHVALFENTSFGDGDGVAIKLHDSYDGIDGENNFLTFLDGNNKVVGRVEGFNKNYDWTPPPSLTTPGISITGGSVGSFPSLKIHYTTVLGVKLPKSIELNGGSWPSLPKLDFKGPTYEELKALMCWAYEGNYDSLMTLDPVSYLAAATKLTVLRECMDGGVVYGSKGADYAEWMPKLDVGDRFRMGQVVGVHGGKISLKTEGAEQIMAISYAPVVLGNLPAEGEADRYERVAFMGQVPVAVRGGARAGDYILASGLEDGTAIAVAPEKLELRHLKRVVGRAWSDADSVILDLVNVVVGVEGNEMAQIAERQATEIGGLQGDVVRLRQENDALQAQLRAMTAEQTTAQAELDARLQRIEAALAATAVAPR